MEIFERIKARREQLGLSQTELAEKVGYSDKSSISKLEKGKATIPLERQIQLVEALNTSFAYLYGETDDPDDKSIPNADYYRDMQRILDGSIDSTEYDLRRAAEAHMEAVMQICMDNTKQMSCIPKRIEIITEYIRDNVTTIYKLMDKETISQLNDE